MVEKQRHLIQSNDGSEQSNLKSEVDLKNLKEDPEQHNDNGREKNATFRTFSGIKIKKPQKNVKFQSKVIKLKVDEYKPCQTHNFQAIKTYLNEAKLVANQQEEKCKSNLKSSKLSKNETRSLSNLPLTNLNQRISLAIDAKKQQIEEQAKAYNIRNCRSKNRFYDIDDVRKYIKEKKTRKVTPFEPENKKCLKSYNIEEVREYMKRKQKEVKAKGDSNLEKSANIMKSEDNESVQCNEKGKKPVFMSSKLWKKTFSKSVCKSSNDSKSKQINNTKPTFQYSKKVNKSKLDIIEQSDKNLHTILKSLLECNPLKNNCLLNNNSKSSPALLSETKERDKNDYILPNSPDSESNVQSNGNNESESFSEVSKTESNPSQATKESCYSINICDKLDVKNIQLSEEEKKEIVKSLVKAAISEISWDKLFQQVLKSSLIKDKSTNLQKSCLNSAIHLNDTLISVQPQMNQNELTSSHPPQSSLPLNNIQTDFKVTSNNVESKVLSSSEKPEVEDKPLELVSQDETKEETEEDSKSSNSKFDLPSLSSESFQNKVLSPVEFSEDKSLVDVSLLSSITSSSLPISQKLALIRKSTNYDYDSSSTLINTNSLLKITPDIDVEELLDDLDDTDNISSIQSDETVNGLDHKSGQDNVINQPIQLDTVDNDLIKSTLDEIAEKVMDAMNKGEDWRWIELKTQSYTENVNSYRLFLFDISKQLIETEFRNSDENPLNAHTIQKMSKIIRKQIIPKTADQLSHLLEDKIKLLIEPNQGLPKSSTSSIIILDYWRKNNLKKSFIDQIIYQEMREENQAWYDCEKEQEQIKKDLIEVVFGDLLKELIKDIYESI